MNVQMALEIVAAETGHRRYLWLCSAANPDPVSRDAYRRLMVRIATGAAPDLDAHGNRRRDLERAAALIRDNPPDSTHGIPTGRICSEDNPDAESREAYRRLMVTLATGLPTPDPAPTPDDEALRSYVRRHGCCG